MRPAGDRGVRRGGSCGFPEETGEEQKVLLRRRRQRRTRLVFLLERNKLFPDDGLSTLNVNLFSTGLNVCICEALRGGGDDCRVRFSFIDKLWGFFFLKSV